MRFEDWCLENHIDNPEEFSEDLIDAIENGEEVVCCDVCGSWCLPEEARECETCGQTKCIECYGGQAQFYEELECSSCQEDFS